MDGNMANSDFGFGFDQYQDIYGDGGAMSGAASGYTTPYDTSGFNTPTKDTSFNSASFAASNDGVFGAGYGFQAGASVPFASAADDLYTDEDIDSVNVRALLTAYEASEAEKEQWRNNAAEYAAQNAQQQDMIATLSNRAAFLEDRHVLLEERNVYLEGRMAYLEQTSNAQLDRTCTEALQTLAAASELAAAETQRADAEKQRADAADENLTVARDDLWKEKILVEMLEEELYSERCHHYAQIREHAEVARLIAEGKARYVYTGEPEPSAAAVAVAKIGIKLSRQLQLELAIAGNRPGTDIIDEGAPPSPEASSPGSPTPPPQPVPARTTEVEAPAAQPAPATAELYPANALEGGDVPAAGAAALADASEHTDGLLMKAAVAATVCGILAAGCAVTAYVVARDLRSWAAKKLWR